MEQILASYRRLRVLRKLHMTLFDIYFYYFIKTTLSILIFKYRIKGTVARDLCFNLRLWGFRLGPTDVTHTLLISVYCPFDLLRFKEGVHQSKTDFILMSDTHALCLN